MDIILDVNKIMFNGFDISTAQGIYLGGNQVQSLYLGSTKIWPTTPPTPHDYSQDYLTITSLSDNNNIEFCGVYEGAYPSDYDSTLTKEISYSTDNGLTWNTASVNTNLNGVGISPSSITLTVLNNGDTLLLKGSNYGYAYIDIYNICGYHWYLRSNDILNISGNIMSMIYGDNFENKISFPAYANVTIREFEIFFNGLDVVNAKNLILPATTLADYCYASMFVGCTSLTSVPDLPATTLADYCYASMFSGCTSLTSAPSLPATQLNDYCYRGMFSSCSSLTTAPELPATTLREECYRGMFSGCTSLNYIKCLATNISASNCTANWVYNTSSTGTFVKNASMASWPTGDNGIHSGWTVIDAN